MCGAILHLAAKGALPSLIVIPTTPSVLPCSELSRCGLAMMGARHPPTQNDYVPLGLGRIILGWLSLAFVIVGFTPTPFV